MIRSGREVSRIEGFSDAVFAFALTLLVVSLEVPSDFEDLKIILRGFVPFAATFALVCWIWHEHYAFFRKFEAEDGLTLVLNCALLFLVLFFVYPLKFVFMHVIPSMFGWGTPLHFTSEADARMMMWAYSAGFAGMMAVFVLLYWNQYRRREALGLTREQVFDAKMGARMHLLSVMIAVLSIYMALTVQLESIWTAGAIYSLMPVVHSTNGWLTGRARARMLPSSTPARR